MSALPLRWLRLYAEFATDPKVQMLSEVDQRRFVMLLCLRCSNGEVTLHDTEIAFQLRISNEEWTASKARLLERNLINDANQPAAWDKRQFVSDSSKSRVSAWRERQKKSANADVTLHQRSSNALDTDTDTDTEKRKDARTSRAANPLFDRFWSAYPLKKSKGQAERAFRSVNPDEQLMARILAGLERAKTSDRRFSEGFTPHASTWLNAKGWEDEADKKARRFPLGACDETGFVC